MSQSNTSETSVTLRSIVISASVTVIIFSCAFLYSFLNGGFTTANFGQWKKALELLSGFYLLFAMMETVLLALRNPIIDRLLGGLSESYRVHRWMGIACAVLLAIHWLVAKGPKWGAQLGLWEMARKKRPAVAGDPAFWEPIYKAMKDMGEWIGYVMIVLLVLALFGRFLRQNGWVKLHRLFGPVLLLGAVHGVCSFPNAHIGSWPQWVALYFCLVCVLLVYLQYCLDTKTVLIGKTIAEKSFGPSEKQVTVAIEGNLPVGVGQFVCLSFDKSEHPHPFTIADVTYVDGHTQLTVIIKALGVYTRQLQGRALTGTSAYIQGPYGEFMAGAVGGSVPQLWIAGGIGVTPFLSAMKHDLKDTVLVWCCRAPNSELLSEVKEKASKAGVLLHVIDSAVGQRLGAGVQLEDLVSEPDRYQCRYCGPQSLANALKPMLKRSGVQSYRTEYFNWR